MLNIKNYIKADALTIEKAPSLLDVSIDLGLLAHNRHASKKDHDFCIKALADHDFYTGKILLDYPRSDAMDFIFNTPQAVHDKAHDRTVIDTFDKIMPSLVYTEERPSKANQHRRVGPDGSDFYCYPSPKQAVNVLRVLYKDFAEQEA